VDRLIALVALRVRLDLRAALAGRARVFGLLLAAPALVLLSASAAMVAVTTVRILERAQPGLVLPVLSAVATAIGLLWSLSPLLSGVALTETHDLGRLLRYPVSLATLVTSSLVASFLQPMVVALVLPVVALALSLAGPGPLLAPALVGLALSLLLLVASGQAVGMVLHALSRNRRLHDRALFVGILLGVLLSLLPLFFLGPPGPSPVGRIGHSLLERDVFALSPFAWGLRAAVHAGRGEGAPFVLWSFLAALAVLAVVSVTSLIARRMYRGELDVGEAGSRRVGRGRLVLPGAVGALLEKDLKMAWRDPRLRAVMMSGLVGPLILLVLISRGSSGSRPVVLLLLASFVGLGTLGFNALGLERHGLALLFGFPVDRFSILVAKNLAGIALRVPGILMLVAATIVLVGPSLVPAILTVLLLSQILASAADNYLAVLFPVPVPGAGQSPHAQTSGARGLGFMAIAATATFAAAVASAPFAFLAWMPYLMDQPALGAVTYPLALAGAAAAYAMLTAGAASILRRREPDILARVLGEE